MASSYGMLAGKLETQPHLLDLNSRFSSQLTAICLPDNLFQSSCFRQSSIKLHMCIYSKATTVVGASSIHNSPVALHIQRMDSLMNYFYMWVNIVRSRALNTSMFFFLRSRRLQNPEHCCYAHTMGVKLFLKSYFDIQDTAPLGEFLSWNFLFCICESLTEIDF